jgi:hypothetical protein
MADALTGLGKLDEARGHLREVHRAFLTLADEYPDSPDVQWRLCLAKYKLAAAGDDAAQRFSEIADILIRLRSRDQLKPEWAKMLGEVQSAQNSLNRQ